MYILGLPGLGLVVFAHWERELQIVANHK